jgi:hypothetical protein
MTDILFLLLAFAGLAILAGVLVVIGRAAAECPQLGGAARVATLVVTTGFAALGAGAIMLIAAVLPALSSSWMMGLYFALGIASIALGIGFYNAASMLREILKSAPRPEPEGTPAAA